MVGKCGSVPMLLGNDGDAGGRAEEASYEDHWMALAKRGQLVAASEFGLQSCDSSDFVDINNTLQQQ